VAHRHVRQKSAVPVSDFARQGPLEVALLVPNLVDHVVAYTKLVLLFARHADPKRCRLRVYVSENSARRHAPLFPAGCTNPGSDETGAETLRELRALGIPVFVAPRSLGFIDAAHLLAHRLEADGIDALILQTGIAFPIDWLAGFWARIPVKVSIHIGTSLFLPGLDATFYDNPSNIERESEAWEPEMGGRMLLRQGTDIEGLREQRPIERSRFGVPADAVVIGTLSNHLRRRLSEPYLRVVATVLRQCPNAWFLALGDKAVPHAMDFFKSCGVADRVRFAGKQTHVGEALKLLDVYANEFPVGGSQSVIEAMACGIPVVAMKWGDGHPESAGAEIVGGSYAIAERDPESYAGLLRCWVESPDERKAAAVALRERAERLFSARYYVASLLSHLEGGYRAKQARDLLPVDNVEQESDSERVGRLESVRILNGVSRYGVFAGWQEALARELRAMGIDATVTSVYDEHPGERKGNLGLGFNLVRRWNSATSSNRHLSWLVDHPVYHATFFMPEFSGVKVKAEACAVACVDEHWAQFGRDLYGFEHIFFAPHFYTGRDCTAPGREGREFDVVFFGSIEKPDNFLRPLERESGPLWPALHEAIETYRNMRKRPPIDEFMLGRFQGLSPDELRVRIMMNAFFPLIDGYFRCLGRLRLLQGMRRTNLHVFGQGPWADLDLPENIVVHDHVPFGDIPAIMADARILLNHAATLRAGAHERIFEALGAGCLVHTTKSRFLAKAFGKEAGISYYDADATGDTGDQLSALLDDVDAVERIRAGQEIMVANHTARNRAQRIADIYSQRWPPRKPET